MPIANIMATACPLKWNGKKQLVVQRWSMGTAFPSPGARRSTAIMPITTHPSIFSRECSVAWEIQHQLVFITGKLMSLAKAVMKQSTLPALMASTTWPVMFGNGWEMTTQINITAICAVVAFTRMKLICVFGKAIQQGHNITAPLLVFVVLNNAVPGRFEGLRKIFSEEK